MLLLFLRVDWGAQQRRIGARDLQAGHEVRDPKAAAFIEHDDRPCGFTNRSQTKLIWGQSTKVTVSPAAHPPTVIATVCAHRNSEKISHPAIARTSRKTKSTAGLPPSLAAWVPWLTTKNDEVMTGTTDMQAPYGWCADKSVCAISLATNETARDVFSDGGFAPLRLANEPVRGEATPSHAACGVDMAPIKTLFARGYATRCVLNLRAATLA